MLDINVELLQWFIDGALKNEITPNKQLAEELHKPVINILGSGLAYTQVISKFNKGFFNFYYLLLIFIANMYGLNLIKDFFKKNNKSTTITNLILKNLDESNGKPNKVWVDKGSEFYNRSMKSFLQNNYIEMHSM